MRYRLSSTSGREGMPPTWAGFISHWGKRGRGGEGRGKGGMGSNQEDQNELSFTHTCTCNHSQLEHLKSPSLSSSQNSEAAGAGY